MNLPSKQQAILDYARQHGQITSNNAYQLLNSFYYHNHEKYIGEILSRMVNAGKLVRIKTGVFEIGNGKVNTELVIKNQESLF